MNTLPAEKQRNRKFKAFLLVFFITAAMLAFHRLSGEQYVDVLKWTFGLFMAGNVGEHASQAIKR